MGETTMDCRVLESKKCTITSSYGWRTINHKKSYHSGVDIVKEGYLLDYITAHSDGKIIYVQDGLGNMQGSGSYGNYVKIDHGNGYATLYAHMEKGLSVKNGQTIKKGQKLGYMGDSGDSYGGHLHFEVWENGTRIDPTQYLNKDLPIKGTDTNVATKYNVGDIVTINGVYRSSTSTEKLQPLYNKGKITRILENVKNPYLIDDGQLGWVNDNCIVSEDDGVKYLSNPNYKGYSIVDGLNQIGVDSSYGYRSKLAKANGISNYQGTAEQNTKLLDLLKKGKLIAA